MEYCRCKEKIVINKGDDNDPFARAYESDCPEHGYYTSCYLCNPKAYTTQLCRFHLGNMSVTGNSDEDFPRYNYNGREWVMKKYVCDRCGKVMGRVLDYIMFDSIPGCNSKVGFLFHGDLCDDCRREANILSDGLTQAFLDTDLRRDKSE